MASDGLSSPVTVAVAPPPGWADKTMIIHSAPASGAAMAANIVVARDALGADENFAAYCARQDRLFEASLPGFAREATRQGMLHGLPASQMMFTWTSAAGPLRQQASFIDAGSRAVVSFTATAPAEAFEAHRDTFNAQLAALRIDGAQPPGPAAP